MRRPALLLTAIVVLMLGLWGVRQLQTPRPQFAAHYDAAPPPSADAAVNPQVTSTAPPLPAFLPAEAATTIALIRAGGPFPYRQDDSVFGNRERQLPERPRGYYHEYTVVTPGARDRGARRIVTGGRPPQVWYYSDDHYQSFKRFSLPGSAP